MTLAKLVEEFVTGMGWEDELNTEEWSVVELPVTGEGASLFSIGALVLKGAFLS